MLEAVEACADDTKGQTCYICTQALHWKTKEGLVRGCSCRGTAGIAHVSCLAEQAKILLVRSCLEREAPLQVQGHVDMQVRDAPDSGRRGHLHQESRSRDSVEARRDRMFHIVR